MSNAQEAGLSPKTEPPPVGMSKTSAPDSVYPNFAKLYLKIGRTSSFGRADPPYIATGNNYVSTAFLIGYVGKQLGKKRFFAFEVESGVVQKGVEMNVTNTQFVGGGPPNTPGHWFPVQGVETYKTTYLSNACMLRFCPIDFFYLKAGLNGSMLTDQSYNQQYAGFTTGYQFGVGLQFMSRIVGGMIEVEGINDFVPATSHASSMVIYNREALINAGIVFNLDPRKKQSPPIRQTGGPGEF
jgi:hypothetical protein